MTNLELSTSIKDYIKELFEGNRGRKGIVADAGIVADNDISRTIIVIKK